GVDTEVETVPSVPTAEAATSLQNGQRNDDDDDRTVSTNMDNNSPVDPTSASIPAVAKKGSNHGDHDSDTVTTAKPTKSQPRKQPATKKPVDTSRWDDVFESMAAQFLAKSDELMAQDKAMYGQVAWARIRGYPYWPGYICDPKMLVNDYVSIQKFLPMMDTHFWVYFYQANNSAPVLRSQVALWEDTSKPFQDGFPYKKGKPLKNPKFDEAKDIAAVEFQLPIEKRVAWVVVKVLDKETAGEKQARKRKAAAQPPVPPSTEQSPPLGDGEAAQPPPKKRRGRPPKNPVANASSAEPRGGVDGRAGLDATRASAAAVVAATPKKRGRPPKAKPILLAADLSTQNEPVQQQPNHIPIAIETTTTTTIPAVKVKGKPGRKPKAQPPIAKSDETPTTSSTTDQEGQQPPLDMIVGSGDVAVPDASPTEPGQPPDETKQPRGRSPKDATPKRRGRPPKGKAAVALFPLEVPPVAQPTPANEVAPTVQDISPATLDKSEPTTSVASTVQDTLEPISTTNTTIAVAATDGADESTPAVIVEDKPDGAGMVGAHDDNENEVDGASTSQVAIPARKRAQVDVKVPASKKPKMANEVTASEATTHEEAGGTGSSPTKSVLVIHKLDLDTAVQLATDLQGCVAGESKESVASALNIMNALIASTEFSLETLQKSGLPAVINTLRQRAVNPNVKKTASALRKHMMQHSGYEKPKPKPVVPPTASAVDDEEGKDPDVEGTVDVGAPNPLTVESVPEAAPTKPADEPDNVTTPEGDDGGVVGAAAPFDRDREIVVEMIQAIITSPKTALYDRFSDTTEEYKTQARRVIFGLRDHDLCRQKVLSGSLHVMELVFASDEVLTLSQVF
ncbi:hypothetical protein DYB26_013240, partial [Aphanomyces astaci]